LEELEQLSGRTIRRLHIVGGGSQSALLNQFAASATGRQVVAGPAEATAIGNVLLQAVALGHLGSLAALRQIVRDSFALQTFGPIAPEAWGAPYQRFIQL
jgi:rhamnulokinase